MILNLSIILISLQIIHLVWLTANITLPVLFGVDDLRFHVEQDYIVFIIFIAIDYLEIPGLFSALTLYILELKNGKRKAMPIIYVIIVILQFLHIWYLTDEYILQFGHILPLYIVGFVILIDYLELTILYDLIKKRITKATQK